LVKQLYPLPKHSAALMSSSVTDLNPLSKLFGVRGSYLPRIFQIIINVVVSYQVSCEKLKVYFYKLGHKLALTAECPFCCAIDGVCP